ncbi:MAG: low affinity iron permease family protein [Rhodoblastus sp.]
MTKCETAPPSPETQARSDALADTESRGYSFGFARFSALVSALAGRPLTFGLALAIVVVWGLSGPFFHYSDTWQLVINTGTTIVTFLMVFVIQNAQNRDAMAIQVKLDELICATQDARDKLVGIENLDDVVVAQLKSEIEARINAGGAAAQAS